MKECLVSGIIGLTCKGLRGTKCVLLEEIRCQVAQGYPVWPISPQNPHILDGCMRKDTFLNAERKALLDEQKARRRAARKNSPSS